MTIYAKVGDGPQEQVRVIRKKKTPLPGESFAIRALSPRSAPDVAVKCTGIKQMSDYHLYMLERT